MKAEYRPRVAAAWYESQWSFFWTMVGALLTAGLIATVAAWLFVLAMAKHAFGGSPEPTAKTRVSQSPRTEEFRVLAPEPPRIQVVTVPAASREECLSQTGGIANDHYARCRRGYTETMPLP